MSKATTDLSEETRCIKKADRTRVNIYEERQQRMGRMDELRNNKEHVSVTIPSEEVATAITNRTTSYPTRKERKRTETMNVAFSHLREHIPNVPTDTKLSKIKTLRLAISYIRYLMEVLGGQDASLAGKRDRNIAISIANQCDTKEKRKKGFEHECLPKRKRGRTGWPQKVWALELKGD